jgi:hypothetical protein
VFLVAFDRQRVVPALVDDLFGDRLLTTHCSVEILNPYRSCAYLILAMTTPRTMTKSPRAVAQQALRLAQDALPAYSSKFSRRDFTQPQLFALLTLKIFFKTD